MKILYGVQGTGNGHITRARAMARAFEKTDVSVDYLFSGRPADKYFDMEAFGDYRLLKGLTFTTANGRVRPLTTVFNNNIGRFVKDARSLDLSAYDVVLTDFEPLTAWAGKWQKKKVIGLGHQYAFHHAVPQQRAGLLQQMIMRQFAPADMAVGLHWHHFGQAVLPPIAPVGAGTVPVQRGHYLVYLPFESVAAVSGLLARFPDYQFSSYHPEATPGKQSNVSWYSPEREGFQRALQRCEGVICNAGFELASEVLQLGRKLLVKPIHGQIEQESNVLALQRLGFGRAMQKLDADVMADWLVSTPAVRIVYPDVAGALCNWLLAGAEVDIRNLADSLWEETIMPTNQGMVKFPGIPRFS